MSNKKEIDLGEYSIVGWDSKTIQFSKRTEKIEMYVVKHLPSGKLLHVHEFGAVFYVDNFNHATFAIKEFWKKYENDNNYQVIQVVV